ncbi:MAG: hypothetical protein WAW00_01450 [Candidatus Moraniibacteriota bacterium]
MSRMGEGNIPMRSGKRVELEMFGEVVFKSGKERQDYHEAEKRAERGEWNVVEIPFEQAVAWVKDRQPIEKTVFLTRLKSEAQALLLKEPLFANGDFRLVACTTVHSYLDFRRDTDALIEFAYKPRSDKERIIYVRIDGTTNDIEGNHSSADVLIRFPNDGCDPGLDKKQFDAIVKRSASGVSGDIVERFTNKSGPSDTVHSQHQRREIDYQEIPL